MWVFGYGSLIWKVDFPVEAQVNGYIKGYVRRFWQGSSDHRGTPQNPGRVVTLIPIETWDKENDEHPAFFGGRVYGVAYKVAEDKVEEVRAHLDFREKNGYSLHQADIFEDENEEPTIQNAFVYIGTAENEAYIGPAPTLTIARHIFSSSGPSGPNSEYLYNLLVALKAKFPLLEPDPHLHDLEQAVRSLAAEADQVCLNN
ncbi:hypothetical protein DSO57_1024365 [Entomophthora muscae]|uniref:Uncharacterized protein n=1 Tax=Entomophthora muscae TaxID=34485 RepID=A0ACC2S4L2_9FUNG|nr:hypothetical protein DSO57_1024365 [Entomophthora muscae]